MSLSSAIATPQPIGWQGSLQLAFAHTDAGTQVCHRQAQAPLKVQRPFYPEGPEVCHSVILHTAGGMVDSDRLTLDLQLHPHAHALLTTTAASKIYRSLGQTAQQHIHIDIAAGACLEWLPQETIAFNQARYRQDLRIHLAPGAHWFGWEITRFGRSARGEKFTSGDWRSHTEVWQNDRPLWIDRQWLPGNADIFQSPHGLANCPVVGSFVFLGQPVDRELVDQARALWTPAPAPIPAAIGITALPLGLLCRYRGSSNLEVRQWFCAIWHLMRLFYLKRPAHWSRVWGA
jgi:urease accessory protein